MSIWRYLRLGVPYAPRPYERPFLDRVEVRQEDDLVVRVSVLDDQERDLNRRARKVEGVPASWPEPCVRRLHRPK